jgi:hypothetical protein
MSDDPRVMLIGGLIFFGWGYALVRYRDAIGSATGYYVQMLYVSSRTPGWLLVPFGVLFMLLGGLVAVGSIVALTWPSLLK